MIMTQSLVISTIIQKSNVNIATSLKCQIYEMLANLKNGDYPLELLAKQFNKALDTPSMINKRDTTPKTMVIIYNP